MMISSEKKLKSLIRESVLLMMEQPDRSKGKNYETDEDMMDLYGLQPDGSGGVAGVKKSKSKGFLNFFGLGDDEEEKKEVVKDDDEETQERNARISQGELKKKGMIASFFSGEEGYDEANGNYYVKEDAELFCLGMNWRDCNFQKMVELYENLVDVVTDGREENGNLKYFTISPYSVSIASKIYKKTQDVLVICLDIAETNTFRLWSEIIPPKVWKREFGLNWKWLCLPFLAVMALGFGPWVIGITGSIASYNMLPTDKIKRYDNPFDFIYDKFGEYDESEGWWGWWNWLLKNFRVEEQEMNDRLSSSGLKKMNYFSIQSLLEQNNKLKNNFNKLDELYQYKKETGEEWNEIDGDKKYINDDIESIKGVIEQVKLLEKEAAFQSRNKELNKLIATSKINWKSENGKKILEKIGNNKVSNAINTDFTNKIALIKAYKEKIKKFRSDHESWWNWLKRKVSSDEYSDYNGESFGPHTVELPDIDVESSLDNIEYDIKNSKKTNKK